MYVCMYVCISYVCNACMYVSVVRMYVCMYECHIHATALHSAGGHVLHAPRPRRMLPLMLAHLTNDRGVSSHYKGALPGEPLMNKFGLKPS